MRWRKIRQKSRFLAVSFLALEKTSGLGMTRSSSFGIDGQRPRTNDRTTVIRSNPSNPSNPDTRFRNLPGNLRS
jgi:hypothetical protein